MIFEEAGNGLETSSARRYPEGGSGTSAYAGGGSSLYFLSLSMVGDGGGGGGGDLKCRVQESQRNPMNFFYYVGSVTHKRRPQRLLSPPILEAMVYVDTDRGIRMCSVLTTTLRHQCSPLPTRAIRK